MFGTSTQRLLAAVTAAAALAGCGRNQPPTPEEAQREALGTIDSTHEIKGGQRDAWKEELRRQVESGNAAAVKGLNDAQREIEQARAAMHGSATGNGTRRIEDGDRVYNGEKSREYGSGGTELPSGMQDLQRQAAADAAAAVRNPPPKATPQALTPEQQAAKEAIDAARGRGVSPEHQAQIDEIRAKMGLPPKKP